MLGIHVGGAGNDWKIGYGFLLGIVMATVIVLEVLHWMRSSEKKAADAVFQMNTVEQAMPSTFVKGIFQLSTSLK